MSKVKSCYLMIKEIVTFLKVTATAGELVRVNIERNNENIKTIANMIPTVLCI